MAREAVRGDRERRGYHRLTAKGHMTQQELVEALADLGETRETASASRLRCAAPSGARRKALGETKRPSCNPTLAWLRRPRDLTPEERYQVYRCSRSGRSHTWEMFGGQQGLADHIGVSKVGIASLCGLSIVCPRASR